MIKTFLPRDDSAQKPLTIKNAILDLFAQNPYQFYTVKEVISILCLKGIITSQQAKAPTVKTLISSLHSQEKIVSQEIVAMYRPRGCREPRKKYGYKNDHSNGERILNDQV